MPWRERRRTCGARGGAARNKRTAPSIASVSFRGGFSSFRDFLPAFFRLDLLRLGFSLFRPTAVLVLVDHFLRRTGWALGDLVTLGEILVDQRVKIVGRSNLTF